MLHNHRNAPAPREEPPVPAIVMRPSVVPAGIPVTQEEILSLVGKLHPDLPPAIKRMIANTQVQTRFMIRPAEEVLGSRDVEQDFALAVPALVDLAERACRLAMENAGVAPEEISSLVLTSTTGFFMPGIGSFLHNRLGLSTDTRLLEFAQAGCAGGALILARAREQALFYPGSKVLACGVEGFSLFLRPDAKDYDHIFDSLGGDGAAACVVQDVDPAEVDGGLLLQETREFLVPGTLDAYRLWTNANGPHFSATKEASSLVRKHLMPLLLSWLKDIDAWPAQFFVAHTGGPAILNMFSEALDLPDGALDRSWKSLHTGGNMGSVGLLWSLQGLWDERPKAGDRGVLWAPGPGIRGAAAVGEWVG